jgi:hypothetical protein
MSPRHHEDDEHEHLPAAPTATPERLHERVSELENGHKEIVAKVNDLGHLSGLWLYTFKAVVGLLAFAIPVGLPWIWVQTDEMYQNRAHRKEMEIQIPELQASILRIKEDGTAKAQEISRTLPVLQDQLAELNRDVNALKTQSARVETNQTWTIDSLKRIEESLKKHMDDEERKKP